MNRMEISSELSARIAEMGLVCACLIVVCHVGNVPRTLLYLCEVALPFFFTISGFLLSRHVGESGWWRREVAKRVRTLLVPFVLINLLYLLYTMPMCILSNLRHGRELLTNFPVWADLWRVVGLNFVDYPMMGVSWFVRALFLMVALSPVIAKVACFSRRGFGVLIWFAVWLCFDFLSAEGSVVRFVFVWDIPLRGIAWFALGIWLQKSQVDIGRRLSMGALLTLELLSAMGGAAFLFGDSWQVPAVQWVVQRIGVASTLVVLFALIRGRRVGNVAFPLYLLHMFVFLLFGAAPPGSVGMWLVKCACGILVPLAVCALIRRSERANALARIVFGGRI